MIEELPDRIQKNIQHFTGRAWVLTPVLDWFENTSERLFLITGEPGTGKSMLAAWLAGAGSGSGERKARTQLKQIRSHVKAAHFCLAASGNTAPKAFAQSLAEQLTRSVPGFGAALATTLADRVQIVNEVNVRTARAGSSVTGVYIGKLDLGALGDELSFDRVLREPLIQLYKDGHKKPMLLVVDAVDEALTYTGSINLAQILTKLTDLPAPIRFLITTRPDPRVLYLHHTVQPFDLIEDAPKNADDVGLYAGERLSALPSADRGALAERIARAAEGNFLYAHLVLEDLLPRLTSLENLAVLPLPKGLSGLYQEFLNRELGTDRPRWLNSVRPVLGLIAVSQGSGLTRDQIEGITKQDAEGILEAWKQYLDGALPQGPFRLFHKSFADFLLQEEGNLAYRVDAPRAHGQVVDFYWPSQNGATPWTGWDDYGLRYVATHLAKASAGRSANEAYLLIERLVRLVVNPEFQKLYIDKVNDLTAVGANLEQALHIAVTVSGPRALPLIVQAARALMGFRRNLGPEPLFEWARRGEIEAAERQLDLFRSDSYWQQAALLIIAWLAAGSRPDRARQLRDQVTAKFFDPGSLQLLLARVDAALDNTPFRAAPLPEPPTEDLARALVARMEGSGVDAELLAQYNYATQIMPTEGLSTGGYLAQEDGPPLVAFAASNPRTGEELFQRYLATHTGYSYVQYRNKSLWYLMDAVLRHPNPDWVLSTVRQMTIAALAGSRLDYEEGATLTIRALQAFAGNAGAMRELEAHAAMVQEEARQLDSSPSSGWIGGTGPETDDEQTAQTGARRDRGDTWGHIKRRLAAQAQAYALILHRYGEARIMLDQAVAVRKTGFTGFGSPACLTLAEAIHIVEPDWETGIEFALEAAQTAAHNVQDATFCATSTARYNAYHKHWWGIATEQLVLAARRLAQDAATSEFAARHRVGEEYAGRSGPGLPPPEWPGHAQTLRQLSELYHRPLADFMLLNREAGWEADQQLPIGASVNVPDPGFATLLAAFFSARLLTASTVSSAERLKILQLMVPVAAPNPTALDTVLARLLLAARPSDPAMLDLLAQLAGNTLDKGDSTTKSQFPAGIPS